MYGIPGTVFATKHWYLPAVRAGSFGGAVRVFNPGTVPVLATVHVALDEGAGAWLERSIPPFSEITFPLASLTSAKELAAEVDATGPVVASAGWTDSAGLPVSAIASAAPARDWSLLVGLAATATQDSIPLPNPPDPTPPPPMS